MENGVGYILSMRNSAPRSAGNTLQSVQNALRILRMLHQRPGLRVTGIATELGMGKSTAYRLLATLESEGFIQKNRLDSSYRAGRVLIDIGIAAVGDLDVRRKARAFMEELADQTGETVNLFLLEGSNARVVDGVEGSRAVRVTSRVGILLPAHVTAGGKALLAAHSFAELRALFPDGLPSLTSSTNTNWDRFEAEIDQIRRQGYATNTGESDEDVCGVAVPVLDRTRRLVAALAVATPRQRMTEERIAVLAKQLRHSADLLSRNLV